MQAWQIALAAALPAATAGLTLALCCLRRLCCSYCCCGRRSTKQDTSHDNPESNLSKKKKTSYAAVLRLAVVKDPLDSSLKHSNRVANLWRGAYPIKEFNWSDHPALVAEAVEHGWATFAFTYTSVSSPITPKLWDLCIGCSQSQPSEPEISWEVGAGADYMQKMRLNPGASSTNDNGVSTIQALQTTLPLPGPPLGSLSFPQEAYFEITILANCQEYIADFFHNSFTENENVKLIISPRLSNGKALSSDLTSAYKNNSYEETNGNGKLDSESLENGEEDAIRKQVQSEAGRKELESGRTPSVVSEQMQLQICAVGLAAGAAPPFRLPGCDPRSVGFFSTGQVFLNGTEERGNGRRRWGAVNSTVGCGFDPANRRIFFTVDGDLVHETRTSTDDAGFSRPLFPTVAANYDITLSANFGQSPFRFAPANALRIADPCFRRPLPKPSGGTPKTHVEDSADLFSMGRIDSQWLSGFPPSPSPFHLHRVRIEQPPPQPPSSAAPPPTSCETESDLFEIALDSRSS